MRVMIQVIENLVLSIQLRLKLPLKLRLQTSIMMCGNFDNEADTTHFFPTRDTWKDKDELLGQVRRQANRAGFTVIIRRSCEGRNAMLELVCERSGEHKVPKTKVKHEATRSRKCGCLLKVHGYS